ncbi:aminodeoxychorismate synthase component I [Pontibacillus marinus]|uniref:Para-aminobenzoate synthase n=1 Tax=Pontibacillus marinus BH030004 = DSM 16465 TaxID=1385511 RepID=A0A0A5HQC2_9BACI|nr:aminodeoxychorismate synthase component I [Pontibacillus marinus]KGX85827.1 para-aminobenzoate synthase [Pontibacillus marinus BH030004 = DSM 16465]
MSSSPNLYFEYADEKGNKNPLLFEDPLKVIQTQQLDEIENVFIELEKAIKQGYYVAGYVAYEAAPAFDAAYQVSKQGNEMPLVWFGVFEEPAKREPEKKEDMFNTSEWSIETDYESYQSDMQRIRQGIEKGDTYQINYTTRMRAQFEGEPFAFYKHLSRNQNSSYCAFLDIGEYSILSASPELFFRKKGNIITTKPMKGTSKRGRWFEEDEYLANDLYHSEKNRAENLMIVDLLRNDLGRMAQSGTVKVPRLFEIETYPTVHQMTSTIQADVDTEKSIYDWFQALFPCGSITGAPKIKTMEYIAELETSPREVYCGAIGYITPEKDAVFNVPIRTVWMNHNNHQAEYGTGGGVTWDSTSKGEYEELQTKAKLLTENRPSFQLLETMKLENQTYPLGSRHLNRLDQSAMYFGYKFGKDFIEQELNQIAEDYPHGEYKVRLLMSEDGTIETQVSEIKNNIEHMEAVLAKQAVDSSDPFLYHKTTHRAVYNNHKTSELSNPTSVLLWNEREEITEFIIGNVVLEMNGTMLTPPVNSGLLAGTFREKLLDRGIIQERVLYKHDLKNCNKVWMINAVRGWVEVTLK